MSTSVKDFFERRVPDALSRHPEKAKEVAATFLFTIAGADGGTWTADLISSPPSANPDASANLSAPLKSPTRTSAA